MRKGLIIAVMVTILLIIGIIGGIAFYKINETKDSNNLNGKSLASQTQQNNEVKNVILPTVSQEEVISHNCMITKKCYYKGCDHIIKTTEEAPESCINLNEEQLKQKYLGWNIEEFSKDNVTIYNEQEGYCPEHYILKEHNGVIGIYTLDENGTQTFKEDTEVLLMYLPEEDLTKLKAGITAIGNSQLRSILEDYE